MPKAAAYFVQSRAKREHQWDDRHECALRPNAVHLWSMLINQYPEFAHRIISPLSPHGYLVEQEYEPPTDVGDDDTASEIDAVRRGK